ncbi:hypothetical protein O7626_14445 [Micromonospora sp. WMMD1102]|uniref:hypothetical protein n=1 Tax=Micromonospora sp. WMMD1102 TaxID=3016105 RepID=UPI002414D946|nr:hypothetical protein [Micromonospora sp. WMMD1102]MDG4787114.1 hypothetical protein [Micromonospora sp. WMMD1102]
MTAPEQATPHPQIARQIRQIVIRAANGDQHGAINALVTLNNEHGPTAVYNLCRTLAEATRRVTYAIAGISADGDGCTMVAVLGPDDHVIEPDQAPTEAQPVIWAARFLAAYSNGDNATVAALFHSSRESSFTDTGTLDRHLTEVVALLDLGTGAIQAGYVHFTGNTP